MPRENDDASENSWLYEDEESILEKQNIKRDYRDLVSKSLNTGSSARDGLLRRIFSDRLYTSELSSFLIEVSFSEQEFPTNKPILNIKYHHLGSQNDKFFYLFNH